MSDTEAWANFVAQLDPAALERERMRAPGNDERPASIQDQRMRTAHAFVAADFWARVRAGPPLPMTAEEWAARRQAQHEDADREVHARGFDKDPEAAVRSYSRRSQGSVGKGGAGKCPL